MHVLSPSQINAWTRCPRHWGFRYVDNVTPEPNRFAALGTAVHAQLEAWLNAAIPPDPTGDAGQIAQAGIPHLPQPGTPGLQVEQAITLKTASASYRGFVDFRHPTPRGFLVGDHKTTTDFQWAKTPEDLLTDTQSVIYAAATMVEFGVELVDLRWIYYRTRGARKAHPVELTVGAAHVDHELARIDGIAREILDAYAATTKAEELPVNTTGCNAYGGCPFSDICTITPQERFKGAMEMATLREMMAARAAQSPATPPPPPAPPRAEPAPEPPPVAAETQDFRKKRGRPLGSKNRAVDAALNPPEAPPAADPLQVELPLDAAPEPPPPAPRTNGASGFALYVDCIPEKSPRPMVPFLSVAAPALRAAAVTGKVADYRLVEFGKGPGLFAAALRDYLTLNPIAKGSAVAIDTRTAEGRDALTVLSDLASEVIRGV